MNEIFLKAHVDVIPVPESGHASVAISVATSLFGFRFSALFPPGKKRS